MVNKSHAVVYSVTSYMTAWLKYYYPVEFYCAALNFVRAQEDIPPIISDARKHGIRILPPDVNKSEARFSVENGAIRFGLGALRGCKEKVKSVTEDRKSGFKNFKQFVAAIDNKAVIEACVYSGACDAFARDGAEARSALLAASEELRVILKEGRMWKAKVLENPEREDAKKRLEEAGNKWKSYVLPRVAKMPLVERLEKELLSTSIYISGNPLDAYRIPGKCREIADLASGETAWITASKSEDEVLKTRAKSEEMMHGKLTDYSDTVDFVIFPQTYQKVKGRLGNVMAFRGRLVEKEDGTRNFLVSDVESLSEKHDKLVVWVEEGREGETERILEKSNLSNGLPVYVTGRGRKVAECTGLSSRKDVLEKQGLKCMVC